MEKIIKESPQLTFSEAIKRNFKNLTNFNGRARRSELWWNYLAYFICSIILGQLLGQWFILSTVVSTLLQLCIVAVTIRRMHDRGQSGIWVVASVALSVFTAIYYYNIGVYDAINSVNINPNDIIETFKRTDIVIINIISFIINLVILVFALMDSKTEDNKYGKSPKYYTF